MDKLYIKNVVLNLNRIECEYDFDGKWREIINNKESFFCEYPDEILAVPKSIAVIPLLSNLLPVAWAYNLEIVVDELDEEFAECLEEIKKGYVEMYPGIRFGGRVTIGKTIKNSYKSSKTAVLFSGGVDAFTTFLRHKEENPDLITVWGSDIPLKDKGGWETVKMRNSSIAKQFGVNFKYIRTNFRTFLDAIYLSEGMTNLRVKGEWWHEFQHGIGLIGLVAPLSYIRGYGIVYIASSFTIADKGVVTCASDPTIDNHFRYGKTKTVHDGYDLDRQGKVRFLCDYVKEHNTSIELHVCWVTTSGKNCCECEKCRRTMFGILAEKSDPNNFGFNFTKDVRKRMMAACKKYVKYDFLHLHFYKNIRKAFLDNYSEGELPDDLKWIVSVKEKDSLPVYLTIYGKVSGKLGNMKYRIKRVLRR